MRKLERAMRYGLSFHKGQVRKNTGIPYFVHPMAVMEILSTVTNDEDILCAAILHDVIEDCGQTREVLEVLFGKRVSDLVYELTKQTTLESGNRATRKALEVERLSKVSDDAKMIKLADTIHNTMCVMREDVDEDYKDLFCEERADLLEVLMGSCPELERQLSELLTNRLIWEKWNGC